MAQADWEEFSFTGIGTEWSISTPSALPPPVQRHLLERVEAYDASWSRFRTDSQVTAMARQAGRYSFPEEAGGLGALYRSLYELTHGAMTPLIGASLEHLGYGAGYSLRPGGAPVPAPDWDDVLDWDGTAITTRAPVVLDIGAAGKGLLVDLLAARLKGHGIDRFIVDGSGDLLTHAPEPVPVALEHPYNPDQAIGIVQLAGRSLCASAANRRTWGDGLHHVLDGLTGRPVTTAVATWVIADSTMLADALATALFFVPGAALERSFRFSWLTVFSDGSAAHSKEFEGTLFT